MVSKAPGMAPTQREILRRHLASAAGRKPSDSLSLNLEISNLEIEHALACAVFRSAMKDNLGAAWERQVCKASSWKKSVVFGVTLTSWQVLRVGDGRMISMKDSSPEDINKTLMRHAEGVSGQR